MPLRLVWPFLAVALLTGQPAAPDISGAWVLNAALTERPAEIGFNPEWARGAGGDERSGGGRGRRGESESPDDSTRVQQLTGEARTPPTRLTIVQKTDSVSIADDQGRSRTFHPHGRLDSLTIGMVPLPTTARWDGGSLVIVFDVATGRQVRYTFTPAANPERLSVEIRLLERGRDGDRVRLTYERPDARARDILSTSPPPAVPPPAAGAAAPAPDAAMPPARPPVLPPGSELRGLTTIGTVVDNLSAQGTACGLDQTKIKTSMAKILADAGFKADRFGNEESYVLLSVVTSRLPDGTCVSRYDASLVSQADATFPHLKGTVAVQVTLLHEGGMAGGSPAAHASAVVDALTKSVNSFVSQIRAAASR